MKIKYILVTSLFIAGLLQTAVSQISLPPNPNLEDYIEFALQNRGQVQPQVFSFVLCTDNYRHGFPAGVIVFAGCIRKNTGEEIQYKTKLYGNTEQKEQKCSIGEHKTKKHKEINTL